MKNAEKRKGKRAADSIGEAQLASDSNTQADRADDKAEDGTPAKRQKRTLPLAGKIVSVSALAESSVAASSENFKSIVALCKEAGAGTTNQIHKKTFCVVATESAINGETQRIRKAWKKGIPVVHLAWVRQCIDEEQLRPFGDFLVRPSGPKKRIKPTGEESTAKAPKDPDTDVKDEAWSEPVELGCCCLCHDTGAGVTDCEWCVDCGVNVAAKATKG